MEVLQNNLNDEVSSEEFFKSMPAMESESTSDVPLLELRRSSLFQPNGEDTLLSALHDLLVHPSLRCGTALLPQQLREKVLEFKQVVEMEISPTERLTYVSSADPWI